MRIKHGLFLLVVALSCSSPVYPWGNEGHQTIGAIADRLIRNSNAEQHVGDLLGGTLKQDAIWADCAKRYCKDWYDDEMKEFVASNPKHHDYHFTDIPIEEDHYFETSVGASDDDIVHIMRTCIAVLRGEDTPVTNPHGFSARTALILLAHFIGDMHQPLHVGAAYVDADEHYVNPNQSGANYESTLGGNYLILISSTNLHAYWDSNAVKRVMSRVGAHDPEELAAAILARPAPHWQTTGDIKEWPTAWAKEVIPIAEKAITPLRLGPRYQAHDRRGDHPQWDVEEKPSNYTDQARDTASVQLAKAGYRLAALLQRIWP
jgi:hypothetical protein